MATIKSIRRKLPCYTRDLWYPKKEQLIKDWLPLVKGDYQGLVEVCGHCFHTSAPKDVMDQLWTELIPTIPTLDDFWSLVAEVPKKHKKELFFKGISLCQTDSDINGINGCSFGRNKEIREKIIAKRQELSL